IPGTLPTRRTTILSLLLPVRTFTALLMVMLSRLMPFTSTNLSPTCRPASSVNHLLDLKKNLFRAGSRDRLRQPRDPERE
uniref:Uncharacterized protein n=1 Tax=Oryzias latipes TaxID=8090 RepID=A0A3P9JXD6_ORYLA